MLRLERDLIDLRILTAQTFPGRTDLDPKTQDRNIHRVAPPNPGTIPMVQVGFVAQQPRSNKPIERFAAPGLKRIATQEHLTYRLVALACDLHTITVG